MARKAKAQPNPKPPKRVTPYSLALDAWRKSGHHTTAAINLLIADLTRRPSLLQGIIKQHANDLISRVMNGTRDATLEPKDEKQVTTYILTPSVIRTPLGASGVRTGTLVERDILDYPLQFLNKSLGDATPEEVEMALDRYEAEAHKRLKIGTGIRAIIKGLPNRKLPVRRQITSAQVRAIAKANNIYNDLIV